MDDLRIIELYFERDEQAIKETDAKYGKLCHSIAYNILNNHEDSEECVNDTYVGVWNAIPPTRPSNFMSFVCKIARNLSLKRLEFMKREKRSADVMLSLDELESVLPDDRYAPDVSDEDNFLAVHIENVMFCIQPEYSTTDWLLRVCIFFQQLYLWSFQLIMQI